RTTPGTRHRDAVGHDQGILRQGLQAGDCPRVPLRYACFPACLDKPNPASILGMIHVRHGPCLPVQVELAKVRVQWLASELQGVNSLASTTVIDVYIIHNKLDLQGKCHGGAGKCLAMKSKSIVPSMP